MDAAGLHEVLGLEVGQRGDLHLGRLLDLVEQNLLLDRKLLEVLDGVARADHVQ